MRQRGAEEVERNSVVIIVARQDLLKTSGYSRCPIKKHIDFSMMHRWFVGLTLEGATWDYSTFSTNRDRLLKGIVMREFFPAKLETKGDNAIFNTQLGPCERWR